MNMHVVATGLPLPTITEAHEWSGLSSSNPCSILDFLSAGIDKLLEVPQ